MPSVRRLLRACSGVLALAGALGLAASAGAWEPLPVSEDPLLRMPGSQPSETFEFQPAYSCLGGCHGAYDPEVEPGVHWAGSMMAQAARDPLFWAALTVAAQDSIWAFGRPNATDLCLRCHSPGGWLGGRSDPTNGSALRGADFDGVTCDFCHRLVDPFFEDTYAGTRDGNDWSGYWDEAEATSTPSQAAADLTREADRVQAAALSLFNGTPAYGDDHRPALSGWTENGSGQYFVSTEPARRGPFADADADDQHDLNYSRYHKSRRLCGTCHDVSNAVLANRPLATATPGDGVTVLPAEEQAAHSYSHIERTFSELMLSAYGRGGGAEGLGPYAPEVFTTSRPGNFIASCQDCHLPDKNGSACELETALVRPAESFEHPKSGQPLHDLTGANVWVPWLLASTVPGSPNHDPENAALLRQGPEALTLDLTQGEPLDPAALLAGVERALANLQRAAAIEEASYDAESGTLRFRIQNQTGHKLITGYPEGRRMFVNVRALLAGELVHEINPYDAGVGTLRGLPGGLPLGPDERYVDDLVYEVQSASTLTGQDHSFHFVLSTQRHKDNRIPPLGFRIEEAAARLAEPVAGGQSAPELFTAEEYAGGYDEVTVQLPPGVGAVEINLYYQTTSREYVAFLRDEIAGTATSLSSPTPSGEPSAYVAQADPFFSGLAAWGSTIWQLWEHNKHVPGAAPVLMAQAAITDGGPCATLVNGSACDDGDVCTVDDLCADGDCAGVPRICEQPPSVCREAVCDAATGGCVVGPLADGTPCNAGLCTSGVCLPPDAPPSDEGCACRTGPARGAPSPWLALLLFLCARRRKMSGRGLSPPAAPTWVRASAHCAGFGGRG